MRTELKVAIENMLKQVEQGASLDSLKAQYALIGDLLAEES